MKAKYVQIAKGCIALVITIACLYIGQAVWQNYSVNLPLDKALHEIEGVETATWSKSNNVNDTVKIYITLGNAANLQKVYSETVYRIEQTLKNRKYTLEIKDNPSPELEQVYYDIHYYIQKSIMDGDFPMLEAKVREKAVAAGAEAKVYVDEQNIYLQLTKNDNSLVAVTPRHSDRIGGDSR